MGKLTKKIHGNEPGAGGLVSFQYGNGCYMVAPGKSKVYSQWVEVETSRAVEILIAYKESTRGARAAG